MFSGNSPVEIEERKICEAYIKKHKVDELFQELVESLLRERPRSTAKEHFASVIRMGLLSTEAEAKDNEELKTALSEVQRAAEVPGDMLRKLFHATKKITSEIVPKETISIIIQETLKLLGCDRVSLFIYDPRIHMLVLNASNLEHPIRVKPGQGISGHVFETKEVVNITDCYEDSRFDQTFDKMTGYRTNNLLTMPIIDFEGECMGVLQAINKREDQHSPADREEPGFNQVDEIVMENLTEHVSIALRNAEVYRAAIVTSERANALLNMLQSLTEDLGAQSMVLGVAMHANKLVRADRCTVFLVDDSRSELWSIASDSGAEIRIPKSAGIAGECASENKLIVIDDAYSDPRFNQEVDRRTGYRTKSIIAVPVKRPPLFHQACAVIQMINKTEFDDEIGMFDEEDIQVLETFSTFVAGKLASSSLLTQAAEKKLSEADLAFQGGENVKRVSSTRRASCDSTLKGLQEVAEGDEDEESDD